MEFSLVRRCLGLGRLLCRDRFLRLGVGQHPPRDRPPTPHRATARRCTIPATGGARAIRQARHGAPPRTVRRLKFASILPAESDLMNRPSPVGPTAGGGHLGNTRWPGLSVPHRRSSGPAIVLRSRRATLRRRTKNKRRRAQPDRRFLCGGVIVNDSTPIPCYANNRRCKPCAD